jgi:predicted acyl esterase
VAIAAAMLLGAAPAAHAAAPPQGSKWTQHTIAEPDGTQLHADVLRPADVPDDQKTPVILSIGPYFNHSGQVGALGPVENAPFDPTSGGPSDRFYDFIIGAKVFQRGYTWVQVDLRGFGGSNGCLDWGGPGEQADVVAAVEWAAKQPWSTGKVGMYGKSYDGVTGLVGVIRQPKGLAAVVSQEPVYDLYRYLYMNRVRFVNSLLTPQLYNAIAGTPGTADDSLAYNFESLNDTARPGCPALNFADQQDRNHDSAYWKQRDLIAPAAGKKTPLFLTQGFIENNTKPDGAFDFYNALAGPKRAWFGMWDHVRGNDRDQYGRLKVGREGWFDETMRFFDRYVAGKSAADAPVEKDPPIALEDNSGKWRSESSWPPGDSFKADAALKPGSYTDDTTNNGTAEGGSPNGVGIWTFSPAFDHEVRFAGVPRITADVTTQGPDANFTAAIYDVDSKNSATLISRGTYLLPGSGKVAFDLYGNDWKLPAGHRFGVLVSSSHAEWWSPTPTLQTVTVKSASMAMPYLSCRREETIQGDPSMKLEDYLKNAPFTVDAARVTAGTDPAFPVPGALAAGCTAAERAGGPATVSASQGGGSTPAGCIDRRKFAFRIHQPRKSRIVRAVAYVNGKRKARARGKRVTRIVVRQLPQKDFTVKIVATAANGQQTVSVRRYRGCRKGRPSTTVRPPR